ncbi:MAG: cadherin-like beta sandwich domain-containing protein, partial [Gammaproteobacteria bacterium]|nr:cadherin-like beta sandwich domain-containing protein [Gammaproteobacteria bacterium]
MPRTSGYAIGRTPLFLFAALALCIGGCGSNNGSDDPPPSGNADLASLSFSDVTIDPAFSSALTSYTADVEFAIDSTTVRAFVADSRSTISVNGMAESSGIPSEPIALDVGLNTIDTVVTAENGTVKTYTTQITRGAAGTDPELADLSLTLAPLDQVFQSDLATYTASSGFAGSSTQVIATTVDENATITVDVIAAP